jgi:putative aldouronate transport system substrate-binding protein
MIAMRIGKRVLICAIVALGFLSGVYGGGRRDTAGTASAVKADRSNFTALGTFPIVKNKETINVMLAQTRNEFNAETNWMTKFYEDKTNVHVNWTIVPVAQYKEKVNLALASDEALDVIIAGGHTQTMFSMTDILKFAEQQLILPIHGLIETDSVYTKQRLNELEGWRDVITLPDGGIYNFPSANDCLHCQYYEKMWVNLEFLKNLNLKIPTTTDEFRDMLIAFRDRDANGNGDPRDEIPLMGATDNFGTKVSSYLMNAFTFDNGLDRVYLKNGKVAASFLQPEYQEGLRYLNQLYRENLVSKDSFTQNRTNRARLNSGKYESIIGCIPNNHHGDLGTREPGQPVRWIDYEPIPPLKGPRGTQITRYSYYDKFQTERASAFIPASSRNPALIVRWLDWFLSEEGTMTLIFGEKGNAWVDADLGATGPDGRPAKYKTVSMQPTHPYYNNFNWDQLFPNFRTENFRLTQQTPEDMRSPDGQGAERLLYVKTKENYVPYGQDVKDILPPLYYSAADVSEVASLTTNINTYVEESIAKFVVGDMNINTEWNTFQNNLRNLGVDRYLEIIQKTYDNSAFVKK